MRTTLRIDDALLAEARALAERTGRTLSQVIEDSLRVTLARQRAGSRSPVELPVLRGGRLRPGVNLDSTAGLLEIMRPELGR